MSGPNKEIKLIKADKVGYVIGRNGKNVVEMEETCNVSIHIGKWLRTPWHFWSTRRNVSIIFLTDEELQEGGFKNVEITGTEENIERAKEAIDRLIRRASEERNTKRSRTRSPHRASTFNLTLAGATSTQV